MEKTFAEDNEKRLFNLKRLQHLAQHEPKIEIICAHDPDELKRYQNEKLSLLTLVICISLQGCMQHESIAHEHRPQDWEA